MEIATILLCLVLQAISTTAEEQIINVNGHKINYLKVGNGSKTLLLSPGGYGTIELDFKPVIEGLDKNKFTIIAWEPPGHGKSRPPTRLFTPNYLQDDADTAHDFMKKLGIKSFYMLGWSDGGTTTIILAAKYPKVIEKIVVWGAAASITPEEIEANENYTDINTWPEEYRDTYIKIYGAKDLQAMQNSLKEVLEGLKKNGGDIAKSFLKDVKCPTLILRGDKDTTVNPEHANYLHKHIKDSKLVCFPDAGHAIQLEFPKKFIEISTKFIIDNEVPEHTCDSCQ